MFPTYEVFVPTDEGIRDNGAGTPPSEQIFLPSERFTDASELTFLPTEPETLHRS